MKNKITGLILVFFHLLPLCVMAQNKSFDQVTYSHYRNGKKVEKAGEVVMKYHEGIAFLSPEDATIRHFIDFKRGMNVSIMAYHGDLYKTETSFDSLPEPTFGPQTESILGYECKYAHFTAFSNKIEVWYTQEASLKGSPYQSYMPAKDALVLKIVINGNRMLKATNLERIKKQNIPDFPVSEASRITKPEFEELRIKSRYTSLEVFHNETINFDPSLPVVKDLSNASCDSTLRLSKGTVILKKIKLPSMVEKGAYVFAKLTCWSNGDAYDRTGSLFMIPATGSKELSMLDALEKGVEMLPVYTDKAGKKYQGIRSEEQYNPPVELMRFFTPFGVRHFNKLREINNYPWKDAVEYKQEITSLISGKEKEIWVGVFIGNYDKGGHKVNLELDFYPDDEKSEDNTPWVQPLFSTVNIMEMSGQNYGRLFKNDTLRVSFEIPQNTKNLQLFYTSTGHGGWGNGDEFVPRMNKIFLDGKPLFSMVPWRTDCGTYRMYNPASGNFSNGLSSSDLSRSNWCPGTLTPPYIIPMRGVTSGTHTIEVVIDQGDDEGSSFSHWNISGVLVGEQK